MTKRFGQLLLAIIGMAILGAIILTGIYFLFVGIGYLLVHHQDLVKWVFGFIGCAGTGFLFTAIAMDALN